MSGIRNALRGGAVYCTTGSRDARWLVTSFRPPQATRLLLAMARRAAQGLLSWATLHVVVPGSSTRWGRLQASAFRLSGMEAATRHKTTRKDVASKRCNFLLLMIFCSHSYCSYDRTWPGIDCLLQQGGSDQSLSGWQPMLDLYVPWWSLRHHVPAHGHRHGVSGMS